MRQGFGHVWLGIGALVVLGFGAGLVAFKIAHDTHRQDATQTDHALRRCTVGGWRGRCEDSRGARRSVPRWRRFEGVVVPLRNQARAPGAPTEPAPHARRSTMDPGASLTACEDRY